MLSVYEDVDAAVTTRIHSGLLLAGNVTAIPTTTNVCRLSIMVD